MTTKSHLVLRLLIFSLIISLICIFHAKWNTPEFEMPTRGQTLTYKELSFPLIRLVIDCNLKSSISIVPKPRLNTDGSVYIHDSTNNGFRVESTGDSIVRVETGTSDIDDGSSKHVTTFRSKH